jgi:hypothetical protein
MVLYRVFFFELDVLLSVTSSIFYKIVPGLSRPPIHFGGIHSEHWSRWNKINDFLHERSTKRGDFRVVIKRADFMTGKPFKGT